MPVNRHHRDRGALNQVKALAAVFLLVGVVLVGVWDAGSEAGTTAPREAGSEARPIVVTRDDTALPMSCRPHAIGKRLLAFTRALRVADETALKEYWSDDTQYPDDAPAGFQWFTIFSSNDRHDVDARGRNGPERALRYVRAKDGIRLGIQEAALHYDDSWGFPTVGVSYKGEWGRGSQAFEGKAAIPCDLSTIPVWLMDVQRRTSADPCPPAGPGSSPGAFVVCATKRT